MTQKYWQLQIIIAALFFVAVQAQNQPAEAASGATASSRPATASVEITRLLETYLANVSDPIANERFWAEDVSYIGSHGEQLGKKEILESVRSSNAEKSGRRSTHKAEDIRVRQYGNTAVVPFKLIATNEQDGKVTIFHHLVIAVFVKRNGIWQVVSWQVTDQPGEPH